MRDQPSGFFSQNGDWFEFEHKLMMKRMRQVDPMMVLLVMFMAACGVEKPAEQQVEIAPPKVLPVTNVLVKDTNLFREYVADIQAVQNVELRARVQGFLERIYVDEGQVVKKGQLLFKISIPVRSTT